MAGQLAKIDLPNKDEAYLRERILEMYANPYVITLLLNSGKVILFLFDDVGNCYYLPVLIRLLIGNS